MPWKKSEDSEEGKIGKRHFLLSLIYAEELGRAQLGANFEYIPGEHENFVICYLAQLKLQLLW